MQYPHPFSAGLKSLYHFIGITLILLVSYTVKASTLTASQPSNGAVTISWTCTGNVRCELKERINDSGYVTKRVSNSPSGSYLASVSVGNTYYYKLDTYAAYSSGGPSLVEADTIMVSPVPNEVLAISPIPNRIVFKNSPSIRFPITITDTVVNGTLNVVASSSNQTLVPHNRIVIGGSGLNRYADITPATNQIGSANITITVTKGAKTATDVFKLEVREVPLRYSGPTNGELTILWICRDATYCRLKSKRSESSSWSIGTANLGSGSSKFSIYPGIYNFELERWSAYGNSSPVLSGIDRINVTINNTAPSISNVLDQSILVNGSTSALAFTVSDRETQPQNLSVTATSSNPSIVPNSSSNLIISGSTSTNNRTIQIKPLANRTGKSTITIRVSDGAYSRADVFDVVVSPSSPATLSYPANDIDGNFPVTWSSTLGVITYVLEYRKNSEDWQSAYSGDELIYPALMQPGSYAFRVKACGLDSVCSAYKTGAIVAVTGSPTITSRRVIFVHSDLLGSPAAETNEQGNENE